MAVPVRPRQVAHADLPQRDERPRSLPRRAALGVGEHRPSGHDRRHRVVGVDVRLPQPRPVVARAADDHDGVPDPGQVGPQALPRCRGRAHGARERTAR